MKHFLVFLALLCAGLTSAEAAPTDLSSAAGVNWEFKPEGSEWKAIQVPAGYGLFPGVEQRGPVSMDP